MSAKILVAPQELRDTAAHFHHSSAEIERITTELRNAAATLDTGCWPAGESARLTARFAEAEVEGPPFGPPPRRTGRYTDAHHGCLRAGG